MNKHRSISHEIILLITVAISWAGICHGKTTTAPNIVVFLSDDMFWHHPGFNGGLVDTPNLDRLAKQGTKLTQFYVHSVCSPTRAAFLTGRYPFHTGMEERSHGNDVAGMLTDERTLAEALKDAGYFTAIIGKWHLGNWEKHHLPMQRGFDYQYGLYGALVGYYTKCRERFYDWHRNEKTLKQEGYTTELIADEFVNLMSKYDSDQPYFIYVPFNATHGPNEAKPELVEKYLKRIRDKSPDNPFAGGTGMDAIKYAMLDSMDTAIGKMLNVLKEKGDLDDTLIVFFNDNGGIKINPPYRGGKSQNYEGGVRVPCILRWPGKVPAGNTVDEMVYVSDLYPTLINLAGGSLEQKLPLDGMDMWDVITKGKTSKRTEVVYSLPGDFGDTGTMAIRKGAYKLVGEELFQIDSDPYETTDISKKNPEVYQALNRRLAELLKERRTPETHTQITGTIDQPLLVFGKEENANPPGWLAGYVRSLPPTKNELKRAAREKKN